ncbi:MAG: phosphate ABC transporter permease PstA [Clostridiales bacterium]|nr:phosphate ABC transporter permease PstA [Clostridiales bacterium]
MKKSKAVNQKRATNQNKLIQIFARIKARMYEKHVGSKIIRGMVWFSAAITVGILAFIILYILVKGIPNLTPELFEWKSTTKNQSMMPSIVNTLLMTVFTLIIAIPIGVGAAIYMVEYAKRGSKLVSIVRITTETLSGIPSIVYGLFGYLFFVLACGWKYSMLAGALTLAIMILPIIIRTTEEALMAVPDSFREGSFGLGAGKLRTVFLIVLPDAIPGILSGVTLAIGRIVGETAALIFTAGTVAKVPSSVFNSTSTLAVHMYVLLNEGLHTEKAYATAVILLLVVLFINGISKFAVSRLTRNRGEQ